MKTITTISEDDLISWLKPYAKLLLRQYDDPSELLKALNWDYDLNQQVIDSRILELFGTTFEEAKRTYTAGFLGKY
ncbi:hypothetical protein LCGC14_1270050 [marine sediment metagenome]|uniref:Uncharacterized protein n=1 Tax=marine sediment metagenome TaxID=412755 RepID=A0A0F9LJC3_9ZZZZ|nr:hypothetical protein [archaeon]HEC37220.1 hypothetical protein [bacterium]